MSQYLPVVVFYPNISCASKKLNRKVGWDLWSSLLNMPQFRGKDIRSFQWGQEIKKYDICTFWEISDTTPQYLSGLFPLRFLFWSGNQIEKFQTCWKSNFKKKLSTLNAAFPGKKVHISISPHKDLLATRRDNIWQLWGLLEQFPFHSSLWSTSIFSQLRSHICSLVWSRL